MEIPYFEAAWASLLTQIDLRIVVPRHVKRLVLAAHDDTCIECHNTDMQARCPKRLALIAVMKPPIDRPGI